MSLRVRLNNPAARIDPGGLDLKPTDWSWGAQFGPREASIAVAGAADLLRGVLDWLAVDLTIYDTELGDLWWGFVHAVELRIGALTYSASLDLIANRVRAIGGGGDFTANDTLSQAMYGIHERIISVSEESEFITVQRAAESALAWASGRNYVMTGKGAAEPPTVTTETATVGGVPLGAVTTGLPGGMVDVEATQKAIDAEIAANLARRVAPLAARASGFVPAGFSPGSADLGATLTCRGHLYALGWRYHARTDIGRLDGSAIVKEVTEGKCAYVPHVTVEGEMGVTWSSAGDETRRALDQVAEILEVGDGARRWRLWPAQAAAYNDRRTAILGPEPDESEGPSYLLGADGSIVSRLGGHPVPALTLRAGFWVTSMDLGPLSPYGPLVFADSATVDAAAGRWRLNPRGYGKLVEGIKLGPG